MHWLDIENICCTLPGYSMSYVELAGTVTGLVSVWLAARANIWTWPVGILNVSAFFILFYQVRLYSDMALQVYFFATSIYGWSCWSSGSAGQTPGRVVRLAARARLFWALAVLAATMVLGSFMSQVHGWWPLWFPVPAAYPYPDAFTTALSVAATLLMARRRLECWALWCTVDVVSVVLYLLKGILLTTLLYLVFLGIASYGWMGWQRKWRNDHRPVAG